MERHFYPVRGGPSLRDHICFAAQPSTVFGSPDEMVQRGIDETVHVTEKLADAICRAVHGKSTAAQIRSAIGSAAKTFGTARIAEPVERELLHGSMLGALDAWFEAEKDIAIGVESFSARRVPLTLADPFHDTKFAARPIRDAIAKFLGKKAVTRDVFDAMEKSAQRKAFTVARIANEQMVATVKRELIRQVAVGADLRDFAKHAAARFESAGWMPANSSHVETVFRTNVLGSYNGGRVRQMTQPEVLDVRPYWQILGVNDGPPRQRATHRAAHGVVLRATDPFWQRASPPFGYNCFLESTPIAGPVIGAARALYHGKTFELTTANGRRFSVTANHPILTARGTVPAKLLRHGDQLIGYRGESRVALLRSGTEWHEHDAPATAEQVFRALADSGTVEKTQCAPDHFHGEAKRFVSKVDVVGSYRELMLRHDAAYSEQLAQPPLEASDALRPIAGSFLCMQRPRLERTMAAAFGAPGGGALPLDLRAVSSEFPPFHELGRGSTAKLYALLGKYARESAPADAQLVGELLQRGTSVIAPDELTGIREFDFAGHVYDFESAYPYAGGVVLADGALVGNCRCRLRSLSVRQGAPSVQSGSSIRGLPDPGFNSGIDTLVEPGTLPKRAPANDPPPKRTPAND